MLNFSQPTVCIYFYFFFFLSSNLYVNYKVHSFIYIYFFFVFKVMTEGCLFLTFMTLKDPTKKMIAEEKLVVDNQQDVVGVGKPAPHVELKMMTEDLTHVGHILTRRAT
ncbi:putative o-succinylbenzoate--CoA ligase [Helianthus anomalus]